MKVSHQMAGRSPAGGPRASWAVSSRGKPRARRGPARRPTAGEGARHGGPTSEP